MSHATTVMNYRVKAMLEWLGINHPPRTLLRRKEGKTWLYCPPGITIPRLLTGIYRLRRTIGGPAGGPCLDFEELGEFLCRMADSQSIPTQKCWLTLPENRLAFAKQFKTLANKTHDQQFTICKDRGEMMASAEETLYYILLVTVDHIQSPRRSLSAMVCRQDGFWLNCRNQYSGWEEVYGEKHEQCAHLQITVGDIPHPDSISVGVGWYDGPSPTIGALSIKTAPLV